MDLERSSNFDETEVSDSLHIDEIAYKEPHRSFYNEGKFKIEAKDIFHPF